MSNPTFTTKDVSDWKAYERVRQSGKWNMFDQRAHLATGLSRERYLFVMDNFDKLKALASVEVEIL